MDNRKWEADAIASPPTAPASPSDGYPTNGNPLAAQNATEPGEWWFHAVGEELRAVIVEGGLTPDLSTLTQLRDAIKKFSKKRLSADITFYVSTTGNDSNDGLSAGSPFLTLQKAWNNLFNDYDLNGYQVTIQLANGTYTAGMSGLGIPVGQASIGAIKVNGNATTPSNVVISTTSGNCFAAAESASFQVQNLKVQTTTSGSGFYSAFQGQIILGVGIVFGACAKSGIVAASRGSVFVGNNYSITGGGQYHLYATAGGFISTTSITATLTGTPAFSQAFAVATDMGMIYQPSVVFSGAATGTRYTANSLSLIETVGGGASFFPGSVAGSVATGAQYV